MRLNAKKTKEFRVSFLQSEPEFDHLTINGSPLEVVDSFKLLGITLSSDLSWNIHVSNISAKASKRLYALRILKRHGVPVKNLISIFCSFIRPVLEYACQVWHSSLPLMLSDQIEHTQKRALKIVFPLHSYAEALDKAKLKTLQERREIQCLSLYQSILKDDNKLNNLLPSPITHKICYFRLQKVMNRGTARFLEELIKSFGSGVLTCILEPQEFQFLEMACEKLFQGETAIIEDAEIYTTTTAATPITIIISISNK
ncbi:RNA-directed DNA polymerase from mobile element jockey [Paramuricea clavata]|uniref:RNA-directed DNA polymerase from mobile element jockey n=1 Tax=Paramuricea clavata TaxID=317549 RepID=A0A7D9IIH2_PARCT|nr:RNA-directed DNA polymerase from mobile element jockey [Paramuricea clavata]